MKDLSRFKKTFDQELLSYLDDQSGKLSKIDPKGEILLKEIRKMILSGGKRLRPSFSYFGYLACGGKERKKARFASFALELGHTFALIHDDIIDNSGLRHGQPTVFKSLGTAGAILAGDLALILADEIFTGLNFSSKAKGYFDLLKKEVIIGEYLDVLGGETEKEVLKIIEYKTARYSVVRPLQIGASLAKAEDKVFKVFEVYGLSLGIALQLADDILGMFGKEEIIGKPVGQDLEEGKVTLLLIKTKERAKKEDREKLDSLLGKKSPSKKDLDWVRNLMVETGSLSYCQNLAKEYVLKAKSALGTYPFVKEGKGFLFEVADFITERTY